MRDAGKMVERQLTRYLYLEKKFNPPWKTGNGDLDPKISPFVCMRMEGMKCFLHFSHPFLGTYEVVQFFDLGYLKGTHSGGWYTAPYPFYGILGWKPHTISFSFQYHVTSYIPYHWNHRGIPHSKASHTIIPKLSLGVWGLFFCKYEIISAGCNTGPLDSIFCGQDLEDLPDILSYNWRLYNESHPLKISSIGLYPGLSVDNPSQAIQLHFLWTGSWGFFWRFKLQVEVIQWTPSFENQFNWPLSQGSLWIIHHKQFKIICLALAIKITQYSSSYWCPTDSCWIPVIPAESSGIRRNQIWQRHQPKWHSGGQIFQWNDVILD